MSLGSSRSISLEWQGCLYLRAFCGFQVRCGEVARTLADLEASKECIAAALLHSVLDTSMLTELQLREVMSKEVADTVCNVHKLSGICQVCACCCVHIQILNVYG